MFEFHKFDKKTIDTLEKSEKILNKVVKSAVRYGHDVKELSSDLGLTTEEIEVIIKK